jgi:CDP-diacylglycerol--glycerol-3-phosphate 3-phosphatidyltransferase
LLDPVVSFLASLGISPMAVSLTGLVLSLVGAVYVATGRLVWGAVILLLSGLCDSLDGSLARRMGKVTTFGAFFDSTIDRITELAYFGALLFYFAGTGTFNLLMIFFILASIAGSFLTSYTRARAEGLGMECRVGLLERPERLAILMLGLLLGRVVLIVAIIFLAFLTLYTFVQRVLYVKRVSEEKTSE